MNILKLCVRINEVYIKLFYNGRYNISDNWFNGSIMKLPKQACDITQWYNSIAEQGAKNLDYIIFIRCTSGKKNNATAKIGACTMNQEQRFSAQISN